MIHSLLTATPLAHLRSTEEIEPKAIVSKRDFSQQLQLSTFRLQHIHTVKAN